MVRFLRRHSLDKSSSQSHLRQQDSSGSSSTDSDAEMAEPAGNGAPLANGRAPPRSRLARDGPPSGNITISIIVTLILKSCSCILVNHSCSVWLDLDIMKEKFAKLLLGEDMSGTGKGVSSALALSNAVTNLAASVFGEHRKLEPMAPDTKERWKKEVGWLLSVTDHIVEFVPMQQTAQNGTTMEVTVNLDLLP